MVAPGSSFRWLTGGEDIVCFERSEQWRKAFCRKCGSPVPTTDEPGTSAWIPAGSLDEDLGLQVGAHIYSASRASWDVIGDDGAIRFDEEMS